MGLEDKNLETALEHVLLSYMSAAPKLDRIFGVDSDDVVNRFLADMGELLGALRFTGDEVVSADVIEHVNQFRFDGPACADGIHICRVPETGEYDPRIRCEEDECVAEGAEHFPLESDPLRCRRHRPFIVERIEGVDCKPEG